ncbi:DUF3644 domain-containing protein [Streptomyces sp. gb14]|uniref:DUF3644 domain-containing protein n=1 Tax=Streptomyces sp. gb14 TaxID=1827753 RepID=UPI000BF10A10|nr:DUF3644 domain-containing protein [Streptomyces sp. gb14]
MAYARWRHMLIESQRHALKAVDEWNCSTGSFGDFVSHMHKAWHYLLHAEFKKDGVDYHYKDPQTGQYKMIDGEPSAWDLERCLKERYSNIDEAVRSNAKLFVQLRNKVEHRYEHNLKIAVDGKAHAFVMNYEHEMVTHFGSSFSLADRLRFPITLQSLTVEGHAQQRAAVARLPQATRNLVAKFEAAIDPAVKDDPRYDYRVLLVPMVGKKTDADLAVTFVDLHNLSEEELIVLSELGRTGTVMTKVKHRDVADVGKMLPKEVARQVEAQVPFEFHIQPEHTEMWRRLNVRPATSAANPYDTVDKYCVYSEVFGAYVYTTAWVTKIVREIGTVDKYRAFFGREPRRKKLTAVPPQILSTEPAPQDHDTLGKTA